MVFIIATVLFKFSAFMGAMLLGAYLLAPLGEINSKDIDMSQFSNTPNDTMMMFFNNEFFSGYLFTVTIALVAFVLYLLWQVHEVAVHKAQQRKSVHIQLVFALSLCGLLLHKAWWVLAIIIAFANWAQIGQAISRVIGNGLYGDALKDSAAKNSTTTNAPSSNSAPPVANEDGVPSTSTTTEAVKSVLPTVDNSSEVRS
ncbi:magnesium transporter [Shewanella intestini]|uniref:Magnesium transporter n=2 Tax=Shewanellaceae TaxID=267890 RepID=A0ABS5I3E5_9GAMM|nr:magnesium transporter [Shewanella intestini]MRG36376.1 magnesium transporter [Shewanella sp. XMDDZSB0408]